MVLQYILYNLVLLLAVLRIGAIEQAPLLALHGSLQEIISRGGSAGVSQAGDWSAATRTEAAIIGAALGDGLGRITEKATHMYWLGRPVFKDFAQIGLKNALGDSFNRKKNTIFYTDDTVMAIPVLEACLWGKIQKGSLGEINENILGAIARGFIYWVNPDNDPLYSTVRYHGTTAPRVLQKLAQVAQTSVGWWKSQVDQDNYGCGSVMRVWPIALVFHGDSDLARVQTLAQEQSLITHGGGAAQAACVAMATGIYYAIRGAKASVIASAMVQAAENVENELGVKTSKFNFNQAGKDADTLFADFREELKQHQTATSDLLRYVVAIWERSPAFIDDWAAPEVVLGNQFASGMSGAGQSQGRSKTGGLLGWVADEAVAAALYVFLRNVGSCDTWNGIKEAVWTVGDSDTIATLSGALLGASCRLQLIGDNAKNITRLENFSRLRALATYTSSSLQHKNVDDIPFITPKDALLFSKQQVASGQFAPMSSGSGPAHKMPCIQPIGFKNETGVCYFISVLQILHRLSCNPIVQSAFSKSIPSTITEKHLRNVLKYYDEGNAGAMNKEAQLLLEAIVPTRGMAKGSNMTICGGSAPEALLVLAWQLFGENPYLFCVGGDCDKDGIQGGRRWSEAVGVIRSSKSTVESLHMNKGSLKEPVTNYIAEQNQFLKQYRDLLVPPSEELAAKLINFDVTETFAYPYALKNSHLDEQSKALPREPYQSVSTNWLYAEIESKQRASQVTWPACLLFSLEYQSGEGFAITLPWSDSAGTSFPETFIVEREKEAPVVYRIIGVLAQYYMLEKGVFHTVALVRKGDTWYMCDNETCAPVRKSIIGDAFSAFGHNGMIKYNILYPEASEEHKDKTLLPSALLFERTTEYDKLYTEAMSRTSKSQ